MQGKLQQKSFKQDLKNTADTLTAFIQNTWGEKKPKLNKVEELAHYLSTFKFKYIQLPSIPCQAFTHIEKSWAIESEILKV